MSFFDKLFGSNNDENQSSKIEWKQLVDLNQLDEIVEKSNMIPVVLFKYSTRCIVSKYALKNFENDFDLDGKVGLYFLDLLNYRTISNEVSNRFGVVHQSPQLIVVKDGIVVYHTSHDDINAADLKEFIQ